MERRKHKYMSANLFIRCRINKQRCLIIGANLFRGIFLYEESNSNTECSESTDICVYHDTLDFIGDYSKFESKDLPVSEYLSNKPANKFLSSAVRKYLEKYPEINHSSICFKSVMRLKSQKGISCSIYDECYWNGSQIIFGEFQIQDCYSPGKHGVTLTENEIKTVTQLIQRIKKPKNSDEYKIYGIISGSLKLESPRDHEIADLFKHITGEEIIDKTDNYEDLLQKFKRPNYDPKIFKHSRFQ